MLRLAVFNIEGASRLIGNSVFNFWVTFVVFNDKGCLREGIENFFKIVLLLLYVELLLEGLFEL